MSKNIIWLILLLFCAPIFTTAQKQNAIWYFGDSCGLDFNTPNPTVLTNGKYINEGSACISDANGKLLFYTDGVSVWNAQGKKMPNGNNLLGHSSSTQSALIVPKPGDCSIYFIFTVPAQDSTVPLSYSIVDLNLDGGLGDIVSKNIALKMGVTERLTATLQENGKDYWVVTQEFGGSKYYSYSVTASGVSTVPIISDIGLPRTSVNDVLGYLKFSNNGKKLCYASLYSIPERAELYDFDIATGKLSNLISLDVVGYGVEFSPDNSKLYISTANAPFQIWQFNLSLSTSEEVKKSKILIYSTNISNPQFGGALQLGIDGKIYVNRLLKSFLGVINQPNLIGVSCEFVDSVVNLLGKKCLDGLPNCVKKYGSNCGIVTAVIPVSFQPKNTVIYPNPLQDYSYLNFDNSSNRKYSVQIFDVSGKLVRKAEQLSGSKYRIDRGSLCAGVYIVELLIMKKMIFTGRLIVK